MTASCTGGGHGGDGRAALAAGGVRGRARGGGGGVPDGGECGAGHHRAPREAAQRTAPPRVQRGAHPLRHLHARVPARADGHVHRPISGVSGAPLPLLAQEEP
eukprot:469377-Prorocentrum_minimum.AAC.1